MVYEGPPARGEIVANVAMSWTIVWLPLTISMIGVRRAVVDQGLAARQRALHLPAEDGEDRRAAEEITDVIAIGRGVGL